MCSKRQLDLMMSSGRTISWMVWTWRSELRIKTIKYQTVCWPLQAGKKICTYMSIWIMNTMSPLCHVWHNLDKNHTGESPANLDFFHFCKNWEKFTLDSCILQWRDSNFTWGLLQSKTPFTSTSFRGTCEIQKMLSKKVKGFLFFCQNKASF